MYLPSELNVDVLVWLVTTTDFITLEKLEAICHTQLLIHEQEQHVLKYLKSRSIL